MSSRKVSNKSSFMFGITISCFVIEVFKSISIIYLRYFFFFWLTRESDDGVYFNFFCFVDFFVEMLELVLFDLAEANGPSVKFLRIDDCLP